MEHLGITELVNVRVAEEQEREVNHEVELERQVEPSPKAQPAGQVVHWDICKCRNGEASRVLRTRITALSSDQYGPGLGFVDRVVSLSAYNYRFYYHSPLFRWRMPDRIPLTHQLDPFEWIREGQRCDRDQPI